MSMEYQGGFRSPILKNNVDFKQLKIQFRNHVHFIETKLWTSIVEVPFKTKTLAANYNTNIRVDTKDSPLKDAKKVMLDIKAYSLLDTALSP